MEFEQSMVRLFNPLFVICHGARNAPPDTVLTTKHVPSIVPDLRIRPIVGPEPKTLLRAALRAAQQAMIHVERREHGISRLTGGEQDRAT